MSERDSHFAGFATLLIQELDEAWNHYRENTWIASYEEYFQGVQHLIACRAYDFAFHVLSSASPFASPVIIQRRLDEISDMECWPDMEKIQKRIQQLEAPLPESGGAS
jgi:hypothetical protein